MAFLDETGLAEVWSLANSKFGKVVKGSYTGAGGSSKTVNLGGRPLMFVLRFDGVGCYNAVHFDLCTNVVGICLGNSSAGNATNMAVVTGNTITDTGITMVNPSNNKFFGNSGVDVSGYTYHYIAVLK